MTQQIKMVTYNVTKKYLGQAEIMLIFLQETTINDLHLKSPLIEDDFTQSFALVIMWISP